MYTVELVNPKDIEVHYASEYIGDDIVSGSVYVVIQDASLALVVDRHPHVFVGWKRVQGSAVDAIRQHALECVQEWLKNPDARIDVLRVRARAAIRELQAAEEMYQEAVRTCTKREAVVVTAKFALEMANEALAREFPDVAQETTP